MRIGLISDTHGMLRAHVFERFAGVDLILHAGDVGPGYILDELRAIAPVHAVMGNTDGAELKRHATEEVALELEGFRIVVVHGHQLGTPTPAGLRAVYPDADIIIYGHTHRELIDTTGGAIVVNPGAAGQARFELTPTVAVMTLQAGNPPQIEHLKLKF